MNNIVLLSSDGSLAMSAESNLGTSLIFAGTSLYKFGGPILMGLGTVSCILSLAVFTKKNLRKNPCSIYFIAYNASNLLLIYTSVLSSTLAYGYNIDPSSYCLAFCRIRFYAMFLFDVLSPSYLILASIDRILFTSRNALTRRRSTPRLAFVCITSITLFWLLAHSHTLVLMNILPFAPGYNVCYFQPGIHNILVSYYSVILKGIIVPVLMLILGLWTIKNVRNVGHVAPATNTTGTERRVNGSLRSAHSKDRQLVRILLFDIGIYLFFTLLPSSVIMYQQVTRNQSQSLLQTRIQLLLLLLGNFSSYISFCVGYYANLLVSNTFRRGAKDFLLCK